ncbi:hypothetical protein A0H81_04706 [Grifola frondosa]|uniref:Uncharacterized protein n=1 Tax=Grifola frondosa TaxID=5627 RepID=A0A1C7MF33_GRIFR|nr:hypothetical protein A0H81_04706 [Grifola frondosa]
MADRARDARSIPEFPDTETASSASKPEAHEDRKKSEETGRVWWTRRRAQSARTTRDAQPMSSKGSSDREIESQAAEKDAARAERPRG